MGADLTNQSFTRVLGRMLSDETVSCSAVQCSGGDTHLSYKLKVKTEIDKDRLLFAKVNRLDQYPLLESESLSLSALNDDYGLNYPKVVGLERDDSYAYLVLKYYDLLGINDRKMAAKIGIDLAKLLVAQHQITSQSFGWHFDNYIGSTAQANQKQADWIEFYNVRRLIPQLAMAQQNGLSLDTAARVLNLTTNLSRYFVDYTPVPSLLHGDLWSGNVGVDESFGQVMLLDPAPYFGDRECDIAFAELFGGFPSEFFADYNDQLPLHENYGLRRPIYNLYHALNHFNLFGSAYLSMVNAQLDEIQQI